MKRAAIGTVLLFATAASSATGCYGRDHGEVDVRVDPHRDDPHHDDHHDDHHEDKHEDHGH